MLGVLPGASPVSEGAGAGLGDKAMLTRAHSNLLEKHVSPRMAQGGDASRVPADSSQRSFAFWTLVALLSVLAVGNLLVTFTILGVLRLGRGMESIQLLPEQSAVQLLGRIELEHVYKRDGLLQGWRDAPLAIRSENGSVSFNLHNRQSQSESRLTVGRGGVAVRGVSGVRVRSQSGASVFSTDQRDMRLADGANTLAAQLISAKRIASPTDEPLNIRSDSTVHLRGAEGTHLESKELLWSADQDVYLRSVNGSIVLSAKEGVFVDVKNMPIAISGGGRESGQFKVCVCMPQGKLFRVAVQPGEKTSCSHVDVTPSSNPCV